MYHKIPRGCTVQILHSRSSHGSMLVYLAVDRLSVLFELCESVHFNCKVHSPGKTSLFLQLLCLARANNHIVPFKAVLNYQRKSTKGWQIWNILLDFSGGSLSIVQLVGDSLAQAKLQGLQSGWTGIFGNPAKLGLGTYVAFTAFCTCDEVIPCSNVFLVLM